MASAKKILDYERELKAVGVPDIQAEIHSQKLAEIIESTLVTREHFDSTFREFELRNELKFKDLGNKISNVEATLENKAFHIESRIETKVNNLETKLENRISSLEANLELRISQMEGSLYKFLVTAIIAMMTISGAMQTIFHYWK